MTATGTTELTNALCTAYPGDFSPKSGIKNGFWHFTATVQITQTPRENTWQKYIIGVADITPSSQIAELKPAICAAAEKFRSRCKCYSARPLSCPTTFDPTRGWLQPHHSLVIVHFKVNKPSQSDIVPAGLSRLRVSLLFVPTKLSFCVRTKGFTYEGMGDYKKALAAYQKSVELEPFAGCDQRSPPPLLLMHHQSHPYRNHPSPPTSGLVVSVGQAEEVRQLA